MTKKRDRIWEFAEQLGNRFRCKFCKLDFAGGILRIKSHLACIQDGDVAPCTHVPEDVQAMASEAITPQKKKTKRLSSTPLLDVQKVDTSETSTEKVPDCPNQLLAQHVVCNNISGNVLQSSHFTGFLRGVADYGQDYELPSSSKLAAKSIPKLSMGVRQYVDGVKETFQLYFMTRMPSHLFTEAKVLGDQGTAIRVALLNPQTGDVVQSGPGSTVKLNIVILDGDIEEVDWTSEELESQIISKVSEEGKSLLSGDLLLTLEGGMGTLGDFSFTRDSSRTKSGKYRLGVKVACRCYAAMHIHGAVSEAFTVEDSRGEFAKKHFPLLPSDYVWRLVGVAMGGQVHKQLTGAGIVTVRDFVDLLSLDQSRLRNITGSGISDAMWKHTSEHATSFVSDAKEYVYYIDEEKSNGIRFNWNYEPKGLIHDGQFIGVESLSRGQKVYLESLSRIAYQNYDQISEYHPDESDLKWMDDLLGLSPELATGCCLLSADQTSGSLKVEETEKAS